MRKEELEQAEMMTSGKPGTANRDAITDYTTQTHIHTHTIRILLKCIDSTQCSMKKELLIFPLL